MPPEGVADARMLDIIIPVLNEEMILDERQTYYRMLGRNANLVFVDGGSIDMTVTRARRFGEVLQTRPGRAYQKNYGVQVTDGDFLLFLNVDSFISEEMIHQTADAFRHGAQAGCYTMHIRHPGAMFRLYEWVVNHRAVRHGIIDADLGMFIRRDVFEALHGLDRLIIMDDIVFSKRLRRHYPITVLNSRIEVSARKWDERGFMATFGQYSLAYLQLWTGIPFFKDRYQNYDPFQRVDHLRPGTETRQG